MLSLETFLKILTIRPLSPLGNSWDTAELISRHILPFHKLKLHHRYFDTSLSLSLSLALSVWVYCQAVAFSKIPVHCVIATEFLSTLEGWFCRKKSCLLHANMLQTLVAHFLFVFLLEKNSGWTKSRAFGFAVRATIIFTSRFKITQTHDWARHINPWRSL